MCPKETHPTLNNKVGHALSVLMSTAIVQGSKRGKAVDSIVWQEKGSTRTSGSEFRQTDIIEQKYNTKKSAQE
jgi:hypothetical protein